MSPPIPASPDLVGIWRPGKNAWADSTVALDAETGKIKWAFQNNYHDIFDMDTMAAPVRIDVQKGGKTVPMVLQTTKQGQVWILNADTGKPVYGWKELPVAKSTVPGEKSSPVQPFPDGLSLAQMHIDRDHLDPDLGQIECRVQESLGRQQVSYCRTVSTAGSGRLDHHDSRRRRRHRLGRAFGEPANRLGLRQCHCNCSHHGDGTSQGPEDAARARSRATMAGASPAAISASVTVMDGLVRRRLMPELVAINLATGKVAWRVPLGDLSDEYGPGAKKYGAPNIGPSLSTAGGLVFLGTTADDRFHIFDQKTGKELATIKMAASSTAAPLTYVGKDGRQYVVVTDVVGGPGHARYRTPPTDNYVYHETLVAFALHQAGRKAGGHHHPSPSFASGRTAADLGPSAIKG